jgi:hypothetical protein
MRVHNAHGSVTFVASGGGGACPTMDITNRLLKFRDDYHGRIRIAKKLVFNIFE